MTLPCGHTLAEHDEWVSIPVAENRKVLREWINVMIGLDPAGWSSALDLCTEMLATEGIHTLASHHWIVAAGRVEGQGVIALLMLAAQGMRGTHSDLEALASVAVADGIEAGAIAIAITHAVLEGHQGYRGMLALAAHTLPDWQTAQVAAYAVACIRKIGLTHPSLAELADSARRAASA